MKDDYEVGQTVWYFEGDHKGKKTPGEIVHIFERYGRRQYVMEYNVPAIGECLYNVRDAYGLAEAENKPIGLWASTMSIKKSWRGEGRNFID